ncbi:MAG: hypothetical protein AB1489_41480, partial [Acidobacteriota bacterium]
DVDATPYLFVPWAENKGDYNNGRKLTVGFTESGPPPSYDIKFWLWERSGQIYYNTKDEWLDNADKVPGDADGGWWKALVLHVNPSGGYKIKLVNLK